jgi:streptomycin 6-kinase
MTVDERLAAHAREWGVAIQEVRTTETSRIGFGTRGNQPVVLKVIRKENSEEWRCGEVMKAFDGHGMIRVIAHADGAVLLPRLTPGHELSSLSLDGRDEKATEIIGSLIGRMSSSAARCPFDVGSVERLKPDFATFRHGGGDMIPLSFVDRAEALFVELCATQRCVRLLHGDLHHHNVLFDGQDGWVVIDPWGAIGEIEFDVGASLRNPIGAPHLLGNPDVIERRLRIYERCLEFDADRALKWSFATTVLGILWPVEAGIGPDLPRPFALAARAMLELLDCGAVR